MMRETQNPQSWQRRILDRVSIVLAVLGVFLVLAFQRIPGVGDPPPFLALPFYAAVAVVWLAALWRGAGFHARAGLVVSALIVALAVGLFRVGYTSGVSLVALAAVLLAGLLLGVKAAVAVWIATTSLFVVASVLQSRGWVGVSFDPATVDPSNLGVGLRFSVGYAGASAAVAIGVSILVDRLSASLAETRRALAEKRAKDVELLAERDIREAAEQLSRAKSAFLANMSHEIRTPMHGILGMLELLSNTEVDRERRASLEAAISSGWSLLQILNDILDVSKIEAGAVELEEVPFDLPELVWQVARVMSGPAAARGNELLIDEGGDLPEWVAGDPGRLRQVLTNLLGNAAKFTEHGSIVMSVRCEALGPETADVTFTVSDTGIGIPEDRLEAIFEEFVQAGVSTAREYGGTGLGLTICRRLVALMGGALRVESRVGAGTRFWFTVSFPMAGDIRVRAATAGVATLVGRRLLVVDGSPLARRIARGTLERSGAQVSEAGSDGDGFAMLQEALEGGTAYDAAVVAGPMGFALAERIRDDAGLEGTRVLLLTSAGEAGEPARARAAGIKAYLTKPVSARDLVTAVRALLGLRGPGEGQERRLVTAETLEARRTTARVLLAEDNPVNQQIAVAILTGAGHVVHVAGTGVEAVTMCRANSYDLVLMDLEMPEMGGLEATGIIRGTAGLEDLPIVALTAHAVPEQEERCRQAGMAAFLTKPFKAPELLRLVAERGRPLEGDVEGEVEGEQRTK